MPTTPQIQQLTQHAISKTRAGELKWDLTADPNLYIATFPGESKGEVYQLSANTATVVLELRDAERRLIFQVSGADVELGALARELINLARDTAINIEDKVADALRGLEHYTAQSR